MTTLKFILVIILYNVCIFVPACIWIGNKVQKYLKDSVPEVIIINDISSLYVSKLANDNYRIKYLNYEIDVQAIRTIYSNIDKLEIYNSDKHHKYAILYTVQKGYDYE